MRLRPLLVATSTLFIVVAPGAQATTYCVGPGACSGTPQATLGAALSAAQTNAGADTVQVGPGTYAGPFSYPGGTANPVAIVGAGRSASGTVLTLPAGAADNTAVMLSTSADVSQLRVLIPAATAAGNPRLYGLDGGDGPNSFHDVDVLTAPGFRQAPASTTATAVGIAMTATSSLADSTFDLEPSGGDTAVDASGGSPGDVITIDRVRVLRANNGIVSFLAPDVRISRSDIAAANAMTVYNANVRAESTVLRATNYALTIATPQPTSTLTTFAGDGLTLRGTDSGTGVSVSSGQFGASAVLRSSVVDGFGVPLRRSATNGKAADLTVSDSDVVGGAAPVDSGPGTLTQTNVANVAPGFTDAAAGDLTLAASSPLIDRGAAPPPGTLGPLDLAGAARIADGNGDGTARLDQGAYERPTPPPVGPAPPTATMPAIVPPPPGAARDVRAPKLRLGALKRVSRKVLTGKRGQKLQVTCDEPCTLTVKLATPGGTALRTTTSRLAQSHPVRLKVTAKGARRRLKRLTRASLRITAKDAAGNTSTVVKTLKLRR